MVSLPKHLQHIDTWLFDMDGMLYDHKPYVLPEIWKAGKAHFDKFAPDVEYESFQTLFKKYVAEHGSYLKAIREKHNVDPAEALHHWQDFDISPVLHCSVTEYGVQSLPGRKIVFTNSSRAFANRILKRLNLLDHLDGIHTPEDNNYGMKPSPDCYKIITKRFDIEPEKTAFFEDTEANLHHAHKLGWTTVLIHDGNPVQQAPHVHHQTGSFVQWIRDHVPDPLPLVRRKSKMPEPGK